jgi:SAM-dependent methyltransferase
VAVRDRLKRLEMRARAALPAPVRTAYRLACSLKAAPTGSPALPHDLVVDGRLFGSRMDLLDALPKAGRIAEIGTLKGDFAREILKRCAPRHLDIIDIDFSACDPAVTGDGRVACHIGLSHVMLARFADATFDWIYVDADHAYAAVRRDIAAAAPKVKPGGFLVFNDFAHIDPDMGRYGVHRAVTEFAVAQQWSVSHLAFQPSGLYDVALRKP